MSQGTEISPDLPQEQPICGCEKGESCDKCAAPTDEPQASEPRVMCEAGCRYGLSCKYKAKWLTPNTDGAFGGRKVCGVHKNRYETVRHRCTPL